MTRIFAIVILALAVDTATLFSGGGACSAETFSYLDAKCATCHRKQYLALTASAHRSFSCENCHEGGRKHAAGGYNAPMPVVRFDLAFCGSCHKDQYQTYLQDFPVKTKYGGGTNPPEEWAKTRDFPDYNTIIDGYGFVKEYNEERAHAYMLDDHRNITRFKYDTCLQCKVTKIAFYWNSPYLRTIRNNHTVSARHFEGTVTIPAGTKVQMATDRHTEYPATGQPNHEAKVTVFLPDGRIYSSYNYPFAISGRNSDPAIAKKARIMTWAALYALSIDGLPPDSPTIAAGVSCNHCHDPHTTRHRIIRKSLIEAIGSGGINPYAEKKVFNFAGASRQDQQNTLCAQCHVEYVCGNSAIDGYDRDFFPWSKVSDLESVYTTFFAYSQDWSHGKGTRPWQSADPLLPGFFQSGQLFGIDESLIKSQHPETETYWNSSHYKAGLSCPDCHMAKATNAAGRPFTSHWFTSPVKLLQMGTNPCARCHSESPAVLIARVESVQDGIFSLQLQVQQELVQALRWISIAKAQGRQVPDAVAMHRQAHVRWENLIVSENSMGFHNVDEVRRELEAALDQARTAQRLAL